MAIANGPNPQVQSFVPSVGYKVDLGSTGYTGVDLLAEADCWCRLVDPSQSDPGIPTTPVPAVGAVASGWRHLRPGDSYAYGFDPPPGATGDCVAVSAKVRWVQIWGIGTGYINIGTTRF